jgi:hypothetical protein
MSKLIHFNTLDLNLINLISPKNIDNKVSCEMSYNNNPLMFFIDSLNVIKFTSDEIILDLRNNDHIKKLFDDLDKTTVFNIYNFLSNNRCILHLSEDVLNVVRDDQALSV